MNTLNKTNIFTNKPITKKLFCVFMLSLLAIITCLTISGCNINKDGIAATVGDVNIMEDEVTQYIQEYRKTNQLESDAEWYTYLDTNGATASDLRKSVIDGKVYDEVIRQLAVKYNITVTQEEIDKELKYTLEKMGSQEEFEASLAEYGMTKDKYMESLHQYLLQDKVSEKILENAELPDDVFNEFWAKYSPKMCGAKGFYEIVMTTNDPDTANKVYNKVKSGEVTFEEELKIVCKEDSYGINFDYVVYEPFIDSPEAVTNAIKNLKVGEVSELIKTDYYYYIVKVVDEVAQEETWSINLLPEQTQKWIKEYAKKFLSTDVYQNEIDKIYDEIGVVIYDMPPGVPYSKSMFN